ILGTGRVRFQELSEFCHALSKLSENNISSVTPQYLRLSCLYTSQFITIAENKFTRLQRLFLRVCSWNAASFDRRMTDAIPEPKWLRFGGQRVAVLSPNRFDSSHLLICLSGRVKRCLKLLVIW